MKQKKNKNNQPNMYFGKPVENAIAEYNNEISPIKRTKLFNTIIYPALNKLAENVIHNRKFYNYSYNDYTAIKHECVVHLYERLNKFDANKGHKAFSYFNRVAINWVFATFNSLNESGIEHTGKLEELDIKRDLTNETYNSDYLSELQDFCQKWSEWGNSNLDYFFFIKEGVIVPFQQRDKKIANAVFDLFAHSHEIDIYNKKALYIMIRERIDVKTQFITEVVNVLRPLCKDMYFEFKRTGTKYWHRYLYYPETIESEIDDIFNEFN